MKTTKIPALFPLLGAALGTAVALSAAGCNPKKDPAVDAVSSTAPAAITTPANPTPPPASAGTTPVTAALAADLPLATAAALAAVDAIPVSWPDLETLTFDRRSEFMAGFRRMEATVDRQIAELDAKRAAMTDTIATRDWDFAMKEMNDSRSYLKSMGDEAAKATAEIWDQQKAKVGQAWVRTQAAYEKVKMTTTS